MERRQFFKTLAAAIVAPLLPRVAEAGSSRSGMARVSFRAAMAERGFIYGVPELIKPLDIPFGVTASFRPGEFASVLIPGPPGCFSRHLLVDHGDHLAPVDWPTEATVSRRARFRDDGR